MSQGLIIDSSCTQTFQTSYFMHLSAVWPTPDFMLTSEGSQVFFLQFVPPPDLRVRECICFLFKSEDSLAFVSPALEFYESDYFFSFHYQLGYFNDLALYQYFVRKLYLCLSDFIEHQKNIWIFYLPWDWRFKYLLSIWTMVENNKILVF